MARYFTLRLCFHSLAACSLNILPYHTLTHVISTIYINYISTLYFDRHTAVFIRLQKIMKSVDTKKRHYLLR